ncbi:hypothetical protein ACF0H5_004959 [Mactra antiquata]
MGEHKCSCLATTGGSINETTSTSYIAFIENEEQLYWTIVCILLFIFGITLATGQYLWFVFMLFVQFGLTI